MSQLMHSRVVKLMLLVGSLLMSWLAYTLVKSWLADWPLGGANTNPLCTGGFWGKSLSLGVWLVAALWFLVNRNELTRRK